MQVDEQDYTRRAFAAYFRSGSLNQPSAQSGMILVDGKYYVHLFSGNKTYAVYRVDTVHRLKRLKRWPKEISDDIGEDYREAIASARH